MIRAEIHVLPFAANDAFANLRGRPTFACLLVGVKIFTDANLAAGAVFAGETIQQAAVALAAVAMAIARLLIKNFLNAGRDGVGVLHERIRKSLGAHGGGESACRRLSVEGRDGFLMGGGLRRHIGR